MADKSRADGGLRELALFAGAGGGILGGHLLGWRTVCAVEWEPYAASVLAQRQNDGFLPAFPIWDDVRTFDGRPWRGVVDVISGGFPCQDISVAGKGAGITGARSGMWSHMARIIGEVRPRFVFVENSPALLTRGLGVVLSDLAALGYDCRWTVLGAADVGAPHQRDRFWLVAHAAGEQHKSSTYAEQRSTGDELSGSDMSYPHRLRQLQPQGGQRDERGRACDSSSPAWQPCECCDEFFCNIHGMHAFECDCPPVDEWDTDPYSDPYGKRCDELNPSTKPGQARQHPWSFAEGWGEAWWAVEPDVGRVAHGVAARVDRLKAIGNGQVPLCAAEAWRLLTGGTA
jgi:DNA (cytosine-5)-methyltransferase 1